MTALLGGLARRPAFREIKSKLFDSGLSAANRTIELPKTPQATLIGMLLLSVGSAFQFSRNFRNFGGGLIRNKCSIIMTLVRKMVIKSLWQHFANFARHSGTTSPRPSSSPSSRACPSIGARLRAGGTCMRRLRDPKAPSGGQLQPAQLLP
jgi:hypothetical protein